MSFGAWTRGTETVTLEVPRLPVGCLMDDAAGHRLQLGPTKSNPAGEKAMLDLPEPLDGMFPAAVECYELLAREAGLDLSTGPWIPSTQDPTRPLSMSTYSAQVKAVAQAATMPHVSTHSFRRSGATGATDSGASTSEVLHRGRWSQDSKHVAAGYVDIDPYDPGLQVDYPIPA